MNYFILTEMIIAMFQTHVKKNSKLTTSNKFIQIIVKTPSKFEGLENSPPHEILEILPKNGHF